MANSDSQLQSLSRILPAGYFRTTIPIRAITDVCHSDSLHAKPCMVVEDRAHAGIGSAALHSLIRLATRSSNSQSVKLLCRPVVGTQRTQANRQFASSF